MRAEVLDIVLTNKDVVGKTLGELAAAEAAHESARGVFLRKVVRADHEMPLNAGLTRCEGQLLDRRVITHAATATLIAIAYDGGFRGNCPRAFS